MFVFLLIVCVFAETAYVIQKEESSTDFDYFEVEVDWCYFIREGSYEKVVKKDNGFDLLMYTDDKCEGDSLQVEGTKVQSNKPETNLECYNNNMATYYSDEKCTKEMKVPKAWTCLSEKCQESGSYYEREDEIIDTDRYIIIPKYKDNKCVNRAGKDYDCIEKDVCVEDYSNKMYHMVHSSGTALMSVIAAVLVIASLI